MIAAWWRRVWCVLHGGHWTARADDGGRALVYRCVACKTTLEQWRWEHGALLLLAALSAHCAPAVIRRAADIPHYASAYEPAPGDSMAQALADLEKRLTAWGITIVALDPADKRGGWANVQEQTIAIDRTVPVNGQLEILAHEAGHFFAPIGAAPDVQQIYAELVGVGVCKFYGFDTTESAARYLARYSSAFGAVKYIRRDVRSAVEALTGQRSVTWQRLGQ